MRFNNYLLIIFIFLCFSCNSPYQKGQDLFEQHCSNCHGKDGEGLRKLYPPINTELYNSYKSQIPCMIRYGNNDTLIYNNISFTTPMPPNDILSDIDIVNLVNYLEWKYASKKEFNSLTNVKKKLDHCN